jgi:hypothetical protein
VVLTCQRRYPSKIGQDAQRPHHDPIQFETQHEGEMLLSRRLCHDPFNLQRNMKEKCSYHEDCAMTRSICSATWRRDALITKTVPWPVQFAAQHEGEMLLSRRPDHDPFNLKCNMRERCSYHEDHTMTHSIWSATWRRDALIMKITPWPIQFEVQHEGDMLLSRRPHHDPFNLRRRMKERYMLQMFIMIT